MYKRFLLLSASCFSIFLHSTTKSKPKKVYLLNKHPYIPMDYGFKMPYFVLSAVPLVLSYCYFISSRIPIGFARLISVLPIICLFTILPMHIPSVLLTSISTFFLTWLANFKLILFAFGRGPLSSEPSSNSLIIFIASTALPIQTKISNNKKNQPSSSSQSHIKKLPILDSFSAKILISAILIGLLLPYRKNFHYIIVSLAYHFLIYFVLDCIMVSSNFLVRGLVAVDLEKASDEPYLSKSLREFWGKRWNLPVANLLWETVYKPVRIASAAVLGDDLAPAPAVIAAFLVSGLMHELLFYNATHVKPTWEMTLFFVMNGFFVVLEFAANKVIRSRWGELPRFVSVPVTVVFVFATTLCLFFPPFMRTEYDVMVLEELWSFGKMIVFPFVPFDA